MKILKNKFDKLAIGDLPRAMFDGRIVLVTSEQEADRAVDFLLSQPILGFDTETKPSFQRGRGMNKVALLQVSTQDTCFLFRLNHIGIPPSVLRLLTDKKVVKVGISWHDDLMQLRRRKDFVPGSFIELQAEVRKMGIEDMSLQKLYANFFTQKISKSQRLTNWETDSLSEGQQIYAATDAWACVMLYNEICRLRETGDYVVDRVDEIDDEDLLA